MRRYWRFVGPLVVIAFIEFCSGNVLAESHSPEGMGISRTPKVVKARAAAKSKKSPKPSGNSASNWVDDIPPVDIKAAVEVARAE